MSSELMNNMELQELIGSLQEGETTENREQPLGMYGRMAMELMHITNPQRFSLLKMQGTLTSLMYRVDEEASQQIEKITQNLLAKDPIPETEDILEKTRHYNKYKQIAEEIVLREIVLIPR